MAAAQRDRAGDARRRRPRLRAAPCASAQASSSAMFAPWPSCGLVECQASPMWISAGSAGVRAACGGRSGRRSAGRDRRSGRAAARVAGHSAVTSAFQASSPAARHASQPVGAQRPEEGRLPRRPAPADRQHAGHHAGGAIALLERVRRRSPSTHGSARPQRAIGERARRLAGQARCAAPSASTTRSNGPALRPSAKRQPRRRRAAGDGAAGLDRDAGRRRPRRAGRRTGRRGGCRCRSRSPPQRGIAHVEHGAARSPRLAEQPVDPRAARDQPRRRGPAGRAPQARSAGSSAPIRPGAASSKRSNSVTSMPVAVEQQRGRQPGDAAAGDRDRQPLHGRARARAVRRPSARRRSRSGSRRRAARRARSACPRAITCGSANTSSTRVDRPRRHARRLERVGEIGLAPRRAIARGQRRDQRVAVGDARRVGREARVVRRGRGRAPRTACANCAVVADRDDQVAVGAGERLIGHEIGVAVAHPVRHLAPDRHPVERLVGEHARPACRAAPCRYARPRLSRRGGAARRGSRPPNRRR